MYQLSLNKHRITEHRVRTQAGFQILTVIQCNEQTKIAPQNNREVFSRRFVSVRVGVDVSVKVLTFTSTSTSTLLAAETPCGLTETLGLRVAGLGDTRDPLPPASLTPRAPVTLAHVLAARNGAWAAAPGHARRGHDVTAFRVRVTTRLLRERHKVRIRTCQKRKPGVRKEVFVEFVVWMLAVVKEQSDKTTREDEARQKTRVDCMCVCVCVCMCVCVFTVVPTGRTSVFCRGHIFIGTTRAWVGTAGEKKTSKTFSRSIPNLNVQIAVCSFVSKGTQHKSCIEMQTRHFFAL